MNIGQFPACAPAEWVIINGAHHGIFRHEQGDANPKVRTRPANPDASYHLKWSNFFSPSSICCWFSNYIPSFSVPFWRWIFRIFHADKLSNAILEQKLFVVELVFITVDVDFHVTSSIFIDFRRSHKFTPIGLHVWGSIEFLCHTSHKGKAIYSLTWAKESGGCLGCRVLVKEHLLQRKMRRVTVTADQCTAGAQTPLHLGGSLNIPIGGVCWVSKRQPSHLPLKIYSDTRYINGLKFSYRKEIPLEPGNANPSQDINQSLSQKLLEMKNGQISSPQNDSLLKCVCLLTLFCFSSFRVFWYSPPSMLDQTLLDLNFTEPVLTSHAF